MHQSTTPSLSQTIWQRWASTQLLSVPIVQPLLPVTLGFFPKLRGCSYEIIEEVKEAVMKVIDTLTQEDFHGSFQKLLEQYNKCIAAEGEYFEADYSFMYVLSIKVPIRKMSGNLFNDPRIMLHHIYLSISIISSIKSLNSLIFTCHPSLLSITTGKSSRRPLVSAQTWSLCLCSSSLLSCVTSTDISDLLSPLLPINHHFWLILRAISRILTELLYVGSSQLPSFCLAMRRGSIGEHHFWVRPCFSSSVLHDWFI